MHLLALGLNHTTAPVEVRERLAFSESEQAEALQLLVERHQLPEAALLSTCNRTEIYGVGQGPESLEAIREFRTVEQSVDPTASAALDIELLAKLESRLIDINARITVQRETLDEDAPSLVALRRQAEALREQLANRRAELSGKSSDDANVSSVTTQLSAFDSLEVERRFAEQSYASALDSLGQARRDADRQQRYLAVHLYPQAAETSEYPKRARNILLATFALFTTWAIAVLVTYSIRDHLT